MKNILHITTLFISTYVLGACSDSGQGNVGWVEITEPTTMNSYIAIDIETITISGESFISPTRQTSESTRCNCAGFSCLSPDVYCETNTYFDTGVTVTVTNLTTGDSIVDRLIGQDGFITNWSVDMPLAFNENNIQVRAEDTIGNHGIDTLEIVARYDTAGIPLWARQIDSVSIRGGLAIDLSGNAYVTSSVYSDFRTFGPPRNSDVYITKYDTLGNPLWVNQFGSEGFDNGNSIAVDTNGNSYVAGHTYGDLAGTGNAGSSDAFIAKCDTLGNKLWVRQLGSAGNDSVNSIAVDVNGNSYVAGYTYGDLAGSANNTSQDVFIAKYDALGNQLWVKQLYSEGSVGSSIAVDVSGNSFVSGDTLDDLTGVGNAGGSDVFIAKYDTFGNALWIKQFGSSLNDEDTSVSVDTDGNSYVTGSTSGDLAGTGNAGATDVFITKYNSSGGLLWIKQFGTVQRDVSGGIAVDANGSSYLTGWTDGELDVTVNDAGRDIFFARYDASGNQSSIRQIGTPDNYYGNSDLASGIAVDTNGGSYIIGNTSGDFTGSKGNGDYVLFIARLMETK